MAKTSDVDADGQGLPNTSSSSRVFLILVALVVTAGVFRAVPSLNDFY